MSKAWADKPEYSKFSDELAKSQDRDFETLTLSLLHVIWPDLGVKPPSLGWLDRAGVDLLIWSDTQPFQVAVQCKGFKVPDESIGKMQIDQCLKSIDTFRSSGLRVVKYLLVHNRTGRDVDLRSKVEAALAELVKAGCAGSAELWDRQRLLRNVFNHALEIVRSRIDANRQEMPTIFGDRQISEPVERVPFAISSMTVDANKLVSATKPRETTADPAKDLLADVSSNLTVLTGGAGYGKTTTVLRTFAAADHLVFYVPASTIPKNVSSTGDFLKHCVNVRDLFPENDPLNSGVFERVFNTVIRQLFKENELSVTLIVDGLDESVHLSRRGGLQTLFNQLRDIRIPIVLTVRKEFWLQKQGDFAELFGKPSTVGIRHVSVVKFIELLDWHSEQIIALAERYSVQLSDDARSRIQSFIQLVTNDQYEEIYGDIPRRPLFLRMILETVADEGVQQAGLARLLYGWASAKIRRDVQRPMTWGSVGRLPIVSVNESVDETSRLAFKAMMSAAEQMVRISEGGIELQAECTIEEVLSSHRTLGGADPTGLFLNSLLLPVPTSIFQPMRVRFAHRVFQEFFLALALHEDSTLFAGASLPPNVERLLSDIRKESLSM